jgi:hypothetical protein
VKKPDSKDIGGECGDFWLVHMEFGRLGFWAIIKRHRIGSDRGWDWIFGNDETMYNMTIWSFSHGPAMKYVQEDVLWYFAMPSPPILPSVP